MRTFRQILAILSLTALLMGGGGCLKPDAGLERASGPGVELAQLEGMPTRWITSTYFDRAMDYSGSRFRVVPMTRLFDIYGEAGADAVVLDCFDDYEGMLPMDDIRRYDLQLAVELDIDPSYKKPGWLNPMLVVVPDGSDAPKQERYMTANIQRVRFVKRADYYTPIARKLPADEKVQAGFRFFQDNCLFCHGLEGVGGNKGTPLLQAFDFQAEAERARFKQAFGGFHHADNPDKQNMEQFVEGGALDQAAAFLAALQ
jgi:mono/diheme cytochrome c family protein